MATTTTNTGIILNGLPFAGVATLTLATPAATMLYSFTNIQSATIKLTKAGSSSSGSENIDITRADGGIVRFPKTSLTLSGIDETEIVDSTGGQDATGLGTISLVTNEAPDTMGWTAFVESSKTIRDASDKVLIVVPTGVTYASKQVNKPDGFAFMIGVMTNDIELQLTSSPGTLTQEYAANKITTLTTENKATLLTSINALGTLKWKRGGTTKDISVDIPDLVDGDLTALLEGKVVFKPITV